MAVVYSIMSLLWLPYSYADGRINLPDIGDSAGAIVTPELERKLGESFIRSIRRHVPMVEDPAVNEYIQSLGRRIAAASAAPEKTFHFFVVDDLGINAFAGPGGYIGINSGLITTTENESELASVVAHEIGHITQKHLQRAIESASKSTIPNAASILAALALGLALPGVGPAAALIAAQAGQVQGRINFTRSHEAEADRAGIQTLAAAGFDPRSMPIFFGRLQNATLSYGVSVPEILLTHPAPTSRVSDTAARAEEYPFIQVNSSIEYMLTRNALRISGPQGVTGELIQTLDTESKQGTKEQKAAGRYGLARAYVELKQHREALDIARSLIEDFPQQPRFVLLEAQQLLKLGQTQAGIKALKQATQSFPHSRAIQLAYAENMVKVGQNQVAYDRLRGYLKQYGASLHAFDLLAVVSGRLGKKAEGFIYRAEYLYLLGQTKDALTQLKQATRETRGDEQLASAIEARIQHLETELEQSRS